MIYENSKVGLKSIMFPVRAADLYVQTGTDTGKYEQLSNKKAVINEETDEVLAIVSESYQVLHNETALKLGRKCCQEAFPKTDAANWEVFSIETPLTHAHCRIDLCHKGRIPDYDWQFGKGKKHEFAPFIRVYNSYNKTYAFRIRFGLIRWACTNGMVSWHASMTFKVAHNEKKMEQLIEARINEAKFRKIIDEFGNLLQPLQCSANRRAIFSTADSFYIGDQKAKRDAAQRTSAWNLFEEHLNSVAAGYVEELGNTGYALMNAVSDVATRPPTNIERCNFIQKERDELQRLVGMWLVDFNKVVENKSRLKAYLENPSKKALLLNRVV